jgi:hypothetical protein
LLAPDSPHKKLAMEVAGLLHSDKYFDAARHVRDWAAQFNPELKNSPCDTRPQATTFLHLLLHWLLNNNGQEEAAQLLWSPNQFTPEPKATRDVWDAFDNEDFILLMGAASQSKSFSVGVKLMLEWIRDPEFTTIKVLGPSEQHLEDNLFSHLVSLHRGSTIPLPGEIGKLFIGTDPRSRKGSITGVVIPIGKRAAGRLQGTKRINRPKAHPIHGPLSRMYIFLDEVSNIPTGIWSDIDNIMSNVAGEGDRGLKIIGAYNPSGSPGDEVGVRVEPQFGWPKFDMDVHFSWKSKRGWHVVRLDAAQSENVKLKRVIYPGLQSYEGFQQIIKNSGGTNSPGYYAMCRACYPPMGTVLSLITQGMINTVKATPVWYSRPRNVGGVDLALEGSDSAQFAHGEWGMATAMKYPPCLKHPTGHTVTFTDKSGRRQPRWVLHLKQIFPLPSADTVAMTAEVIRMARLLGVAPAWLCVDRTGNGQGVYDLLKHEWSEEIIGVNYSESPTETKIMEEDTDLPTALYDRIQTELWYALRKFIEFGYLKLASEVETEKLFMQLTGRLFRSSGKKSKIEAKADYKSRFQGKSPDEADSTTLLVHAVRVASGVTLGMDIDSTDHGEDDSDDWGGDDGPRISVENRFDDL